MTFNWESNYDCTDLTCYLPEGYYLRVEQMDKHSWWWVVRNLYDTKMRYELGGHPHERSLMKAMRAAQSAYLEHVKTEAK